MADNNTDKEQFDFTQYRPDYPERLDNPEKIKAMMHFASLTQAARKKFIKTTRETLPGRGINGGRGGRRKYTRRKPKE